MALKVHLDLDCGSYRGAVDFFPCTYIQYISIYIYVYMCIYVCIIYIYIYKGI